MSIETITEKNIKIAVVSGPDVCVTDVQKIGRASCRERVLIQV